MEELETQRREAGGEDGSLSPSHTHAIAAVSLSVHTLFIFIHKGPHNYTNVHLQIICIEQKKALTSAPATSFSFHQHAQIHFPHTQPCSLRSVVFQDRLQITSLSLYMHIQQSEGSWQVEPWSWLFSHWRRSVQSKSVSLHSMYCNRRHTALYWHVSTATHHMHTKHSSWHLPSRSWVTMQEHAHLVSLGQLSINVVCSRWSVVWQWLI